ncbi:unnamed protein product [Chrysodeixis includens]|uniref:Uncharacterized protein n=1 Tax=Chrysodeixis includens TaxID=689277 RepID=A0A9N8PZT5_CHRIL|nr:unnamed protein product [Chrysodeixis includens]
MLAVLEVSQANIAHNAAALKPFLDPKRRSEIVDEAFLEQKDILLDMLEAKLKEVRDKKKRKPLLNMTDLNHFPNNNHIDRPDPSKLCDSVMQNVDVKVRINGISAIGDADLQLKYGNSGKGTVNLEANGISNVGKVRMEMGVGDSAVYIPGLSNLFIDRHHLNCTKQNISAAPLEEKAHDETRRIENEPTDMLHKVVNATTSVPVHAHRTHEVKNVTVPSTTLESTTVTPVIVTTVAMTTVNANIAHNNTV